MDLAIDCRLKLSMANPFPPDLWGYMHEFGHQLKGLIAPLAYYDRLKVWQVSLCQTW